MYTFSTYIHNSLVYSPRTVQMETMLMENIYHQQYVEIVDPLSMAQVLFLVWSHGTSQNKNGLRRYNPGLVTKDVAKCWGSRTIRQP